MKEKIKWLYEIKSLIALFFMGEIIIYSVIAYFMGIEAISISLIWQLLVLATIIVFLQYFLFSYEKVISIPAYIRVIILYISILLTLVVGIKWFNWFVMFPSDNLANVIKLSTFMYIGVIISSSLYNKVTGERFNEKLNQYKKNNK